MDQHSQVALLLTFPGHVQASSGHRTTISPGAAEQGPQVGICPIPVVMIAKPQCLPQQLRKFEAVGALTLRGIFVSKAITANHRSAPALPSHGAFPGAALETHCSHISL